MCLGRSPTGSAAGAGVGRATGGRVNVCSARPTSRGGGRVSVVTNRHPRIYCMAGTLSHLNEGHYCRSAITAPEVNSPLTGKDSDAAKPDGR